MPDSLWPYGPYPIRLLCPWDSPSKNTGVGFHTFLQVIFLTQELNTHLLCLLHWQAGSLSLSTTWDPCSINSVVVQSSSCAWLLVTQWTVACQASLSLTISWSLPKFTSIESVMLSKHLILYHPLLLLPSIFPRIRVFFFELAFHIRWPKYWTFDFSISPSNEYSGLISFRIDWLALLDVQGTLKSLLQYHSLKASILWCSAFFRVQLSHPCMTTWKTIALTMWTFVGKVMSLLFNTLSKFVIAFLPRCDRFLIS